METSLCELTIKEALTGLESKKFSVGELVGSCLARIEKVDGRLKAFLTVDGKGAQEQAQRCDEELVRSGGGVFDEQPLFGIPVAIKDLFSTQDLRTTAGAKIIENYLPPYEATVVARLKKAGAIVIGKTNEDAWGHGSSGENSDYFSTRNPYDLERVPGGSSSGSGAAVAAGECLAATGTDTGSSVRLPAAFCNLVGLKPTYGRVSRYGIIAMASSFDSIGHLTRTVYDNALILAATAGKDDLDATTTAVKVPPYTRNLGGSIKGWRIGVPREYFIEGVEKEVEERTQAAVDVFQRLGAEIKEISLPHTKYAMASYYILVPSEISSNLARFDGLRFGRGRETFGAEAKRRIMLGTYTLSAGYYDAYYLKAAKVRTLVRRDFEEAFANVDVVLAPTSPTPPFKLGEKTASPLQMYLSDIFLCPVNLAGIPSLSVPAGFVGDLPVGIQLIGPAFSEEKLYQAGYAFEQETKYYERKPEIVVSD
jgi:aspartyl-tRNA(Asn)/glutamyl-tRNA(Gln) amidotransferase subunit A